MMHTLLFPGDSPETPWLRLEHDRVSGEGSSLDSLPPADPALAGAIIAVVPGDHVVLHWVELPVLAPAQAAAAARILAADVAATPIEDTHVALGRRGADGMAPLALVEHARMKGWLATLAAAGIDPDHVVPAPLLLPLPLIEAGVMVADAGGQWQVRGPHLAFAAEPSLAKMMIGTQPIHQLSDADWRAALPLALAALPIDLRQGEFTRILRQPIEKRQIRRVALLALALLAVLLSTQLAGLLRQTLAADSAETQLADAARATLPRGTIVTDPRAQVAARLAALGGDGPAFAALAAPLLTAMQGRSAIMLESITYTPQNGLVASLTGGAPPDVDAIVAAIQAAGLEASAATPRDAGGKPLVDLSVRRR
jgi:general secretion pathway protein L